MRIIETICFRLLNFNTHSSFVCSVVGIDMVWILSEMVKRGDVIWRRLWIAGIALLLSSCLPMTATPTLPPTATLAPSPTTMPSATIVWFPPTPTHTPFPTPTPLPATPDQHPGLGGVIFQDDFKSAGDWALSNSAYGSVALSKNKLTIAITVPKSYLSSVRSQPVFGNFYAEITASPNLCRGADEYGLLVRVTSAQDYYRFSVACNGQTRLDRIFHGQASSPQPWIMGSRVPVGSPSTSRLAVWALGDEMRFFINDEYQFTVHDPLLTSGALGVFARSAGDSAETVNFSDLVVRNVQN
jgi:hypothetical protein